MLDITPYKIVLPSLLRQAELALVSGLKQMHHAKTIRWILGNGGLESVHYLAEGQYFALKSNECYEDRGRVRA
jgi:hypothetical protein